MYFVIIDTDNDKYIGAPCFSLEEAEEVANQHLDKNLKIYSINTIDNWVESCYNVIKI